MNRRYNTAYFLLERGMHPMAENSDESNITRITVEDIQNSLRIDLDVDIPLITRLIATAEAYVQNAVDSSVSIDAYREQPEFNTAVALFAEYLYQSRGIASDSPTRKPFEITALILQLKGKIYGQKNGSNLTASSD